jgi:hypothetical protein
VRWPRERRGGPEQLRRSYRSPKYPKTMRTTTTTPMRLKMFISCSLPVPHSSRRQAARLLDLSPMGIPPARSTEPKAGHHREATYRGRDVRVRRRARCSPGRASRPSGCRGQRCASRKRRARGDPRTMASSESFDGHRHHPAAPRQAFLPPRLLTTRRGMTAPIESDASVSPRRAPSGSWMGQGPIRRPDVVD